MPPEKRDIVPLFEVLSAPSDGGSAPHSVTVPMPPSAAIDWDRIEPSGGFPSYLRPVKMPVAHLSIQIGWMHRLIAQGRARSRRSALVKARLKARRDKRPAPATEEHKAQLRARAAAYQRLYRKRRALERAAIKGRRLTEEERRELAEHRRRSALIKKTKARKRRRELRRAYLDSLIRDMEHRRQAKGRGPAT